MKLRKNARMLLLQSLYSWEITRSSTREIAEFILSEHPDLELDELYFKKSLQEITQKILELDELFSQFLSRKVTQLDPIELNILRIGAYEFAYHLEIPYRVIINEALELAKQFGGTDGHKFVNGVLDKLAKQLRAEEINSKKKDPQ